MKFATAVRHLAEMANVSTDHLRLRDSAIGWPLRELWVTGELLEAPESLEWGSVRPGLRTRSARLDLNAVL